MQAHAGRRCVRQGERGRLDYGQGRGGDGMVRGEQINRNLN